jgi:hypothetical protein
MGTRYNITALRTISSTGTVYPNCRSAMTRLRSRPATWAALSAILPTTRQQAPAQLGSSTIPPLQSGSKQTHVLTRRPRNLCPPFPRGESIGVVAPENSFAPCYTSHGCTCEPRSVYRSYLHRLFPLCCDPANWKLVGLVEEASIPAARCIITCGNCCTFGVLLVRSTRCFAQRCNEQERHDEWG